MEISVNKLINIKHDYDSRWLSQLITHNMNINRSNSVKITDTEVKFDVTDLFTTSTLSMRLHLILSRFEQNYYNPVISQ